MRHIKLLLCLVLFTLLSGVGEAKIYDCFLFFNELEILDIRLHELYDHVDKFVLVESLETFRGKPKPLYFTENRERYAPFADKIIHIVVEEHIDTQNPWVVEAYQRNQIMRGLRDCSPADIVIISDVDEILKAKSLNNILGQLGKKTPAIGCYEKMYRHFLNVEDHIVPWVGSVVTTYAYLSQSTPELVRQNRWPHPRIPDAGWHFTSMGGVDALALKLESFSHIEADLPENKTQQAILNYMQKHCTLVPVDASYPQYVQDHLDYIREKGYIYEEPFPL